MSSQMLELSKLDRKELIRIFGTLEAPSVDEMNGEFRASLLDQGRWVHNFFTNLAFNVPGGWISKSFQPLGDGKGHGYNSFRFGRAIRRTYAMQTYVGPSNFDSRPSYHLDYSRVTQQQLLPKFSKLAGEVRKLDDAVYLGMGSSDFGFRSFHRAQPFLLEGPHADFFEVARAA